MDKMLSKIGQLFIIGFKGAKPSNAFLNFIKEVKIGGVILFAENCPDHQTTRDNINQLKRVCSSESLFIAVDQEGGRVSRIKGTPAEIQDPFEYAENLGIEKFAEDYRRSMVYLESLGFNLNFAPVCDIFTNKENSCLEGRCFGTSADQVIPFVERAVQISNRSRMLNCLKHFPGLGNSGADPHFETSTSFFSMNDWATEHKRPFAAGINCGADMVMTTHLKVPSMDEQIVTGSQKILQHLLRGSLAFEGCIVTDDMTMKGASELGEIGERTIKAFNAGHDLLLFGNDSDSSMEAYEYFRQACQYNEIDSNRLNEALDRIAALKFKISKSISI